MILLLKRIVACLAAVLLGSLLLVGAYFLITSVLINEGPPVTSVECDSDLEYEYTPGSDVKVEVYQDDNGFWCAKTTEPSMITLMDDWPTTLEAVGVIVVILTTLALLLGSIMVMLVGCIEACLANDGFFKSH